MSSMGLSITLANSIIGVGILAMPYCFQQCGVLMATLILLFMGLVSRLSCYFLLKSAIITRRRNFEFLAFYVFGYPGKIAVEMGIIGFLMGTCVAYFVVVGDLGPQIIAKVFNINQSDILRTSVMVMVSLVCVLPLGLLRNVDSLSNVSAATIAFYFCLVIKLIVEAMSRLVSQGSPGRIELWRPDGLFQCIPIFSMALFCQTQLFELFDGLPPLTLEKMNVVTKNAINICTGVYFTLGLFGYIAFSSQDISGNVLSSLGASWGGDVIRLGFVLSLAFSFPLVIFPCRASVYSFLYRKIHPLHQDHIINHSIPTDTFRLITISIIGVALLISLMIPNIELVLGLLGSTIGVLICVVFPAACFVNVTYKDTNERILAKIILILGLFIMILGTLANLEAAENKNDTVPVDQIDRIMEDFLESKIKTFGDISHKSRNESKQILKNPEKLTPKLDLHVENMNKEKNEILGVLEISDTKEIKSRTLKNKTFNDNIVKPETALEIDKAPYVNADNNLNQHIAKEKQLIETIKQHGEEQKELLKEQKEILNKMIQQKEELQLKNKENKEDEAKKIAVESIKKIANIAIDSLSANSEKVDTKVFEPIQKVAIKAKEEIAQKAIETIQSLNSGLPKNQLKQESIVSKIKNGDINNAIPNSKTFDVLAKSTSNLNLIQQKNEIKMIPDLKLDGKSINNDIEIQNTNNKLLLLHPKEHLPDQSKLNQSILNNKYSNNENQIGHNEILKNIDPVYQKTQQDQVVYPQSNKEKYKIGQNIDPPLVIMNKAGYESVVQKENEKNEN